MTPDKNQTTGSDASELLGNLPLRYIDGPGGYWVEQCHSDEALAKADAILAIRPIGSEEVQTNRHNEGVGDALGSNAKSCIALPLSYRPKKHDDWGWIRDANGDPFVNLRIPFDLTEDDLDKHRRDKTDPCEARAMAIINAMNATPASGAVGMLATCSNSGCCYAKQAIESLTPLVLGGDDIQTRRAQTELSGHDGSEAKSGGAA